MTPKQPLSARQSAMRGETKWPWPARKKSDDPKLVSEAIHRRKIREFEKFEMESNGKP